MNRKEGDIKDKQLVVRCSKSLIDQIDKLAKSRSVRGERWSRGDAARFLIEAGLARADKKRGREVGPQIAPGDDSRSAIVRRAADGMGPLPPVFSTRNRRDPCQQL